jgi:hypothetical protein
MKLKNFLHSFVIACTLIVFPSFAEADVGEGYDSFYPYSNIIVQRHDVYGAGIKYDNHVSLIIPSRNYQNQKFNNNQIIIRGRIYGGGILGSSIYHDDILDLRVVYVNDFIGNVIDANILWGGGILGSDRTSMCDIEYSVFTNNNVEVHVKGITGGVFGFQGGGIIGLNGTGSIGAIYDNKFTGNTVISDSDILGGGIIGTYGGGTTGYINKNTFTNNIINVGRLLEGGGIIGGRVGAINNSTFTNNTVTVGQHIDGGGIIGGTVGAITNNTFTGNTVTATAIWYNNDANVNFINGGIVNAGSSTVTNNVFKNNTINAYRVAGGGILASTGNISGNQFIGNTINASELHGGGIIGLDGADIAMGDVKNVVFDGNTVTVQFQIVGGGILGIHNDPIAEGVNSTAPVIGDIIGSTFINNTVSAMRIGSGGILGTTGGGSFGNISNSKFADNTVTASFAINAGVVYSVNNLTITDSEFTGNTATSTDTR